MKWIVVMLVALSLAGCAACNPKPERVTSDLGDIGHGAA